MHCPILVSQIASKYKHAIYLVFWPIFGLMFHFCENLFHPEKWHIIHCTLDDMIPFCEWFVIPYVLWFALLVFGHAYTFFTRNFAI